MPAKKKVNTLSDAKRQVYESIGVVAHDANQTHRNYSYTSHQAVTASVVPAMYEAGLTARFKCEGLTVMDGFALFHCKGVFFHDESGEKEVCTVYAGDKLRDGTTMGAIMSYAVKTCYVKYFGLSTKDKDLEEIQAEQDAAKEERARMKAVKEKAKMKTPAEETEEIFNGTEMCNPEQQSEFMTLCAEFDLSQGQIEKRLEFEGVPTIEAVPKLTMQDWIDSMNEKLEAANAEN